MSLNIYFLRHGQTALSRANHFCGCGSNPELTEEGVEMAQQFAQHYAQFSWKAVYCSNLRRAVSTAAPLIEQTGLLAEQREGLKEIDYGKWEGLTVDEAKLAFRDDHSNWTSDPASFAPTGGETAIQISQRVQTVLKEVKDNYQDGNILIVSHKATIRIALCALLGIALSQFRVRLACPVASLSMIEMQNSGPLLNFLADRNHLPKRLRDLPGT